MLTKIWTAAHCTPEPIRVYTTNKAFEFNKWLLDSQKLILVHPEDKCRKTYCVLKYRKHRN